MLSGWPAPVLHFIRTTAQKCFSCHLPLPPPPPPLPDHSASQCQWSDANACLLSGESYLDYLLENAVMYWLVLWFVGVFFITVVFYYCLFLKNINFSSGNHQVDGRKVEQVPSCHLPQLVPQGAWVVSGGWRIAAPPSLLTQLPAPEIKLDRRHCVLVKDMDHVKGECCKNLRYTCINSCDCWDSIFIDFSGSSALLEIHSLN